MNKYILILIAVLTGFNLLAGNEAYSVRREGTALVTSSTVPLFSIYDGQYATMQTTAWQSQFVNTKVSNFLRLGINPDVAQTNVLNGSMTFDLKVWTWDAVNNEFDVTTISNIVLSLYYEHTNPTTVLVDEMSTYDFSDAHRVDVYLKTITNTSGFSMSEVFVQSDMVVERNYLLDNSAVSGLDIDAVSGSPFYEFQWNPKTGAEWYELEWVHVQDTKLNGSAQTDLTKLKYDYYLNSTRILVKGNAYRIPAILDKGWLLFRVRPIGFMGSALNIRKEGTWSTTAEAGTVSSHTTASRFQITSEYDAGMNWSHQVAYGDDGERFESVAFADGLGRARQTVAHNTETKQAVVSNVYYDELGRPVIADLPTPLDDDSLKHYPKFNKADGTTQAFSVEHFNSGMSDDCSPSGAGFSTASGAGKYYSPSNPDQDGKNKRIPDAKKFPYNRVVYENDFSGRVQKVSGYGDSLRTGSGRETFYFYPSANQEELNRLFGAEVGYASHYSKMVTVDPNGQIYVQYADMAGRVIVTYLAGNTPASLDAIEGNGGSSVITAILPKNKQHIDSISGAPSATLTYHEFIYADGAYTFNYAMTPQQFRNACMVENICLDCVYDLDFRILDACDDSVYQYTETLMGYDLDKVCTTKVAETYTSPAISLQKGAYTIVKTLSINQEKLKENWCYYIENNTCVEPLADVFNDLYEAESFDLCNDSVDDVVDLTGCEGYREAMLKDLIPGGQYAQFVNTGGVYTALPNTSSVHTVLTEDNLGTNKDWRNPTGGYKDENGNPAKVEIKLVSVGVYNPPILPGSTVGGPLSNGNYTVDPERLTNLHDFITHFEPSWAEALLEFHPEHCFLVECEQNDSSNDYDSTMLATWTFDDACTAGYFKPLASSTGLTGCSASALDPFFNTGGNGSTLNTAMNNAMNNYQSSGHSIWKMAIYEVYCNSTGDITTCFNNYRYDTCLADLLWVTYRDMYLGLKSSFVYQAMTTACDNSHIGVDADWIDFAPRWGNIYQFTDIDTDGAGPDTGNTPDQAYFDGLIQESCETTCEAFADDWIDQLAGCDFVGQSVDTAALKDDLVALCMSGCDSQHPMGSTTAPPGYSGTHASIHDVLRDHLGATYETNLCSELLISNPGPYRSSEELENLLDKSLDTCGCEAVLQAQWEEQNDNPNGWTVEQILALNTGVTMEDAHYLICACDKAVAGDYEPGDVTWISGANEYLESTKITIPATLACSEGNGCTDCAVVLAYMDTLNTRFAEVTDFENAENYSTILTNYLNNELGFHLSYYDYTDFIAKCSADEENPYCTVTPEAKEWAAVMKLIAFRGQLLNGSGSAVDLLAQNIVYANSDLQHQLPGNQYWSSLAGDVLTVHMGTTVGSDCSFELTLPDSLGFEFADIVSFGNIVPLTGNCTLNTTFKIGVTYRDCGELSYGWINGTSECLEINSCVCDTAGLRLCDELPALETTCYQPRLDELYQQAETSYLEAIRAMYLPFIKEFNAACAQAFDTEAFSYTGPRNTYQYTLFYYDQAGNLVKTVAPSGVNLSFNPVDVETARESVQSSTVYTAPTSFGATNPMPVHTYETVYKYNSYDQLVNTTNPDQQGATRYLYDRYGRLVLSQNPIQTDENKYSYVLYDAQGRPIESGQIDRDVPPGGGAGYTIADITETQLKTNDLGTTIKNWIYSGVRTEVTYTVYDKPLSGTISAKFAAGSQQNLRLRVATVMYFNSVGFGAAMPTSGYASATHYSYDLHGNVIETLQDVPELAPVQQDIKSTQYQFELISGNVEKVEYQKGKNDQTTHSYTYDKLNRLEEVHFSSDGGVHVNREAHYRYFDYGPLARVEIGQQKVQANDYTYTINGWLKGMNSNTLDPTRDGGKDGSTGYYSGNASAHRLIARDMNGYTLGYFRGDYASIGSTSFEAAVGTGNNMANAIKPLFNGNIAHSVTAINGYDYQAGVYSYDQLQRLKKMRVFINQSTLVSSNTWTGSTETTDYYSDYSYDKNGNLMTLVRNGYATSGNLTMDNFAYSYTAGMNRLRRVTDGVAAGNYSVDIDNQTTADNYTYDKLGQLVGDVQEGMALEWRKGDKKLLWQQDATAHMAYVYNPLGRRVMKIKKAVSGGSVVPNATTPWEYTLYAYDANGQVMTTYTVNMPSVGVKTVFLDEQMIYGAERLGLVDDGNNIYSTLNGWAAIPAVKKNQLGKKRYELTNWLGNVNVVINDRKQTTQASYIDETNAFESAGNVEGWLVVSPATRVATGGQLVVTTSTTNNYTYKNFTTVVGEEYTVTVNATQGTSPGIELVVPGSTQTITSGVTKYITFTATSTSSQIRVKSTGTTGSTIFYVQDINIRTQARYDAVALMKADYYPFGMTMPGRSLTPNNYRYAYNGMEQDQELKGQGNSYTTEFRQYDPRLGRWMSLDPLMAQFPWQSPYCAFDNNPVFYTDPLGLAAEGGPNKDGTSDPPAGSKMQALFKALDNLGIKLDNIEVKDKHGNAWIFANGQALNYGKESFEIVHDGPNQLTDLDAAKLAGDVYNNKAHEISGWKESSAAPQGVKLRDDDLGFQSRLYERTKNGTVEYAYVYAGSNEGIDWLHNGLQPYGYSGQYYLAIENAKRIVDEFGADRVTFVGHSLGGGEATAATMATGAPAIVFNTAWVSNNTVNINGLDKTQITKVTSYVIGCDVLTNLQAPLDVAKTFVSTKNEIVLDANYLMIFYGPVQGSVVAHGMDIVIQAMKQM